MDLAELNQASEGTSRGPLSYGYAEYTVVCVNPTEEQCKEAGSFKAKAFEANERVVDFILQAKGSDRKSYLSYNVKMEKMTNLAWVNGKIEKQAPADNSQVIVKNELGLQFFLRTVCRIKSSSAARFDMKLVYKNDFSEIASALEVCKNNTFWALSYQTKSEKDDKTYVNEVLLDNIAYAPNQQAIDAWEKRMSAKVSATKTREVAYKIVPYTKGSLFLENGASQQTKPEAQTSNGEPKKDDDLPF